MNWNDIESRRLVLQAELDAQKSGIDRNKLGQYATPTALARDMLAYGLKQLPDGGAVRFLDPAIGTGSFYAALGHELGDRKLQWAKGFEIDRHYGEPAAALWKGGALDLKFGDFTEMKPAGARDRANLFIANPPYVRHHHIPVEKKASLQIAGELSCGVRMAGLSGLYCHFLALSHQWMDEGGVAGWLIPSEFMDVNYGAAVKRYLLSKVTLLRIHRFDPVDVQFEDALVSSAVVWFKKGPPPPGHHVEFSFGGTLGSPKLVRIVPASQLDPETKWTRYPHQANAASAAGLTVGDLFAIKRGIATGDNGFFVMSAERAKELDIPRDALRPILPSTRYVPDDEIFTETDGTPRVERRLFLLDCRLDELTVERSYPALWRYLETGKRGETPVAERYLCRSRKPWYSQERRATAPLLCTYMGRGGRNGRRPFRFFLNHSEAIAGNVYLMLYPKPLLLAQLQRHPDVIREVWSHLNALDPETLLGEGRVYGGGLYKLEPRELAKVPLAHLGLSHPGLDAEHEQEMPLFARKVA